MNEITVLTIQWAVISVILMRVLDRPYGIPNLYLMIDREAINVCFALHEFSAPFNHFIPHKPSKHELCICACTLALSPPPTHTKQVDKYQYNTQESYPQGDEHEPILLCLTPRPYTL